MPELYYTPPSDEIFEEVKSKAIDLWKTYDEPQSATYMNEKVGRVERMKNIQDNMMCIFAMFDSTNQKKLATKLSEEARDAIRDRMIDGGQPSFLNPFLIYEKDKHTN